MEVTLAAHGGLTPPADTFVSLRIGQVQRHARFATTRVYRFPEEKLDPKACGRVEVFKRLGATTVCLGSSCGDVQDIEVPCNDPNFSKLRMRVTATDCLATGDQTPSKVQKKSTTRVNSARRYLADHQLEDVLKEAMKEVMSQKPTDPHDFLAQFILRHPSRRLNLPPLSPARIKQEDNLFPPITEKKPMLYQDALEFKETSAAKSLPPPSTPTQRPRNLPPIEKTSATMITYSKSTPALSQPVAQKSAPPPVEQMEKSATVFVELPEKSSPPPPVEVEAEEAPVEEPTSPQTWMQSPSVGTWCAARLTRSLAEAAEEPMPTTELTEPVPAGSKVLPVAASGGFTVGDPIYIESTAGSETNAIKGFGSIALMYPLKFSHPPGTSIGKLKPEDPRVKTLPPDFLAQVKEAAAAPEAAPAPETWMQSPSVGTWCTARLTRSLASAAAPEAKSGFAEYYSKHFYFGSAQIMGTMARSRFAKAKAVVAEPQAQTKALAGFADYYSKHFQGAPILETMARRMFPSRQAPAAPAAEPEPAPASAPVSKWQLQPSVGTWCARRPATLPAGPAPAAEEPEPGFRHWNLRPSIGTWLAPAPTPLEDKEPEYRSFLLRPSVGTWCALIVGSTKSEEPCVERRPPNIIKRQSTVKFRTPAAAETKAMTTLLQGRLEEIEDLERQHATAEQELKETGTEDARELVEIVGSCLDAARAEYEALQQWGVKRGLSTPSP